MNLLKKYSRRNFIKYIPKILFIPIVYFFYKSYLVYLEMKKNNIETIKVSNDFKEGVNIFEKFIIIKRKEKYFVFLNKCTHLGCNLFANTADELNCNCHGSRFDLSGNLLMGPAKKKLIKLDHKFSADNKQLIIKYDARKI